MKELIKLLLILIIIYVLFALYYADFNIIYWSQKETKQAVFAFGFFFFGWFAK